VEQAGLLEEIENCREELINLSKLHGTTSDIVLKTSKKLDHLLNKYQKSSTMSPTQYL